MLLEKVQIRKTKEVDETHLAPYVGNKFYLVDDRYLLLDDNEPDDVEETINSYGKERLFKVLNVWE
jgi:hypothetical protein